MISGAWPGETHRHKSYIHRMQVEREDSTQHSMLETKKIFILSSGTQSACNILDLMGPFTSCDTYRTKK